VHGTSRSASVAPANGGTTSVVCVHSSERTVVPQSARAPKSSKSRSSDSGGYARRVAAIRICASSSTERTGAPAASTCRAKRSVGSAACSRRAAPVTAMRSSGIEPAPAAAHGRAADIA
jgi:hypothetical protein